MEVLISKRWWLAAGVLYLLALLTAIYFENYYVALLPLAIVVMWAVFFKPLALLFFIVLCTPFSLNIENFEIGGIGMYLPTEPLMFGLMLVFLFRLIYDPGIDGRIFRHPVSYVLYAALAWMFLTSITSEMPVVSFKFLLARMWFIASFYFLAAHFFLQFRHIKSFVLFYVFPLTAVVIYTVVRHAGYGFDKDSSHWVMEPFYKDHTSYGAVLAMFVPVVFGLLLSSSLSLVLRVALAFAALVLSVGTVLSYTRAAWISLVGAAALYVVMQFRISLRLLMALSLGIAAVLYVGWDDIMIALERNKQQSSDKLEEHVGSISNVRSDASNLERLNRWHCAFEMWQERPLLGWGPGTYQFVYAPFQRSKDRTIISTNEGTAGNAHSEYFGPLSEQGLPGMLLVLALLIAVFSAGFRLYYALWPGLKRTMVISLFLGLVTYFIHGSLNNFLDTDKAGIPFWGFIAALVAMDLRNSEKAD